MLRSILRLGTNSRAGINLINITRLRPYSVRRPVKIVEDEEERLPLEEFQEEPRSNRKKSKASDVYRRSQHDGHFYVRSQVTEEPPEPDTDVDFKKYPRPPWTELSNDLILCKYMLVVKSRGQRRRKNITLLEGKRLISDALLAGVKLEALFVSKRTEIKSLPLPSKGFDLYWIPYKYFMKWAAVTTSSGIMAIVEIPSTKETAPDPNSLPLTVICDNIRDPGNMGAILRVLAAVGCSKVFIMKGCVDIWEPKVLRAGAGGHFRVPIEYDVDWEYVNSVINTDSEESLESEESPESEEPPSVFLADSWHTSDTDAADSKSSDSEENEGSDSDQEKTEDIQETENSSISDREVLQALPYYNLQFKKTGKNVLVISNESFGPTQKALAFTSERKGVKVHVPLFGNVESLNVASALSVIAFEMRRQMEVS